MYILVSSILLPACLCAPFTHHTNMTKHTWQLSSGSAAHTSVNQSEPATDWLLLLLGNVAWWLHDCLIAWSHTCKSASTGPPYLFNGDLMQWRREIPSAFQTPNHQIHTALSVQFNILPPSPCHGQGSHKKNSRILLLLCYLHAMSHFNFVRCMRNEFSIYLINTFPCILTRWLFKK